MFRVTHVPNVPGPAFTVEFDSLAEADAVREALADYDLLLLDLELREDFSNVSLIEELVDNEWEELEQEDIDERMGRL